MSFASRTARWSCKTNAILVKDTESDHEALKWFLTMTYVPGKLSRWLLRLSEFDFGILHSAGVKQQAADALSRLETIGIENALLDDDLPVFLISTQDGNGCFDDDQDEDNIDEIDYCMENFFPSFPEMFAVSENETISSSTIASVREFLQAQKQGRECYQAVALVGMSNRKFSIEEFGILI